MPRGKATLKGISIQQLQSLLAKKIEKERKKLPALKAKRNKLASQVSQIEAEIAAIGGTSPKATPAAKAGPKKRRRPAKKAAAKNVAKKRGRPAKAVAAKPKAGPGGKMTLPQAIHKVLSDAGKPMKAVDIRNAVIAQKLVKSVKKSFPTQVSIALSRRPEFKKVSRGVYSL